MQGYAVTLIGKHYYRLASRIDYSACLVKALAQMQQYISCKCHAILVHVTCDDTFHYDVHKYDASRLFLCSSCRFLDEHVSVNIFVRVNAALIRHMHRLYALSKWLHCMSPGKRKAAQVYQSAAALEQD